MLDAGVKRPSIRTTPASYAGSRLLDALATLPRHFRLRGTLVSRRPGSMRSIALFVALCGFYALLSGQFHNPVLMISGVVGAALVTALVRHLGVVDDEGMPVEFWVRTALYAPWLLWQIILANVDVAKRVWSPRIEEAIDPRMIKVPHRLKTEYGIATYANSITLTPGTVTADINDEYFVVHALSKEAADDLLGGDMERHVLRVEGQRRIPSKNPRSDNPRPDGDPD